MAARIRITHHETAFRVEVPKLFAPPVAPFVETLFPIAGLPRPSSAPKRAAPVSAGADAVVVVVRAVVVCVLVVRFAVVSTAAESTAAESVVVVSVVVVSVRAVSPAVVSGGADAVSAAAVPAGGVWMSPERTRAPPRPGPRRGRGG